MRTSPVRHCRVHGRPVAFIMRGVPSKLLPNDEEARVDGGELVIDVERQPGMLLLVLHGELDLAAAPTLAHEFDSALSTGDECVVLDLRDLQFLDSTGLRVLLDGHRRLREAGCELAVRRGPRAVQRLFELTGAESVLHFVS